MNRLVVGVAVILAVVILFVPIYILGLTWSGSGGAPEEGRITLNTKDSARLVGSNPTELSIATSHTLFPEGSDINPNGVVVAIADDWRAAVVSSPLVHWLNGPLLLSDGSDVVNTEAARLNPIGVDQLEGVGIIQVGVNNPIEGVESTSVAGNNAVEWAARVDELVDQIAGSVQNNVILVPDDPAYAIPAAYYAAQSGNVVLFNGDPLPDPTRRALERRNGAARIFIVGSTTSPVDLSAYGTVLYLAQSDPISGAVTLAEYYDQDTDFGWGKDYTRYFVNQNFIFANLQNATLSVGAIALGRFGKYGPLLWVEHDSVPNSTNQYLWKMRPEYFVTPAEGPFNFAWFLGGTDEISSAVQGEIDRTQEIGSYRFEESGLSAMEVIWVVWVVFGLVSGIWIALHSWRRIPQMSIMMRVTWALFGFVVGPLALLLYRHSYHRRVWMRHDKMIMWERGAVGQVLAASAMNRGFDGPLMLVISWLVTFFGMPLLIFRGPLFWMGNSMFINIIITYIVALLIHWLVMHSAMFMEHEQLPYPQAVRKAFQPAFLSMTAMAIGMMGYMWWLQMVNLMMEGMPDADEIMWWGTTLLSIVAGWLVALPVDAWLVKRQKQPGTM